MCGRQCSWRTRPSKPGRDTNASSSVRATCVTRLPGCRKLWAASRHHAHILAMLRKHLPSPTPRMASTSPRGAFSVARAPRCAVVIPTPPTTKQTSVASASAQRRQVPRIASRRARLPTVLCTPTTRRVERLKPAAPSTHRPLPLSGNSTVTESSKSGRGGEQSRCRDLSRWILYGATGWSSVEESQAYARSSAFVLTFASPALAIAAMPPSWQPLWLLGVYSQP
eukprot:scaffold49467_cov85-Phaeocystis_antarctica.AAC.5